ncbi:MAG TPA: glycosyltransferase family 39 protein [Solirubrobacterales bacterium]|nr:glycosyltransferase family 39 protein [Solirubrobacterales bacterium]
MKGLAARNGGRVGLAALVAILLLGLGLRVDDAWEGRAPVYDAAAYATIAANLERGEGFTLGDAATQPASNYSPGLPLFVAGLYALSGGVHERLARVVLALVGSLSVLFAYLIGRRLSGPGAGLIGAGAVAIYPALLEYQGMLMSEPLAATLLSGAVLAMLWAAATDPADSSYARWLVPGVLLGALALTRPEYLAISLPIAVVVFARGGRAGWRPCLAQAAIMVAGLAIILAPWTIRNAVALDRFVPVSTGGGQVLFSGAYLPSGGDPEKVGVEVLKRHPGLRRQLAADHLPPGAEPTLGAVLASVRLEQILSALAAQRYPDLESDAALARMGRERLWSEVSGEPLPYAGFVAAKIGRIWSHGPRDVMHEPLWAALHWALIALGLLGLAILAWQRRWEALLLGVVLVAVTATAALLVASPRRLLVAIPLLAALAGVGAVWVWGTLSERSRNTDEARLRSP